MSANALFRVENIIENLHTYFPSDITDLNELRSPSISNKASYDKLVSDILIELPKKMGRDKLKPSENIVILTPETGANGGAVLFNLRPENTSNTPYENTYDNFKNGILGLNYFNNNLNTLRALYNLTYNDNIKNITTKTQVVYFPEPDTANCLLRFSTTPHSPYGYLIYTRKIKPKL
jgi:hypothetical protein